MAAFIQYGGIRLDVMVNTTGVKSLRTDMAALTRVMHEAQGPAGKLTRDLKRLAVVNKEEKVDQDTSKAMMDAIIARYLKSAKSVQEYEKAIAHLITVVPTLETELKAMAKQYRDTAEAEQLAAAKTRQANNLARQARRDAMAEVQKAEREAERAARKAQRDADAEIARNKKLVDSANMLAAGKNKAARQVVRDLERISQAYATGNLSATANMKAQNNVVEAFLRGAKGPREMAAAVDFLKTRYPGLHTFIQMTVNKINAEAAADKAAADAKRAAAKARKDAEAQAKADLAVVSNLYKKAAGDVGVYTEKLKAIKAVAAAGSASQTQLNMAIRQAAKEYFANAKSVQDVIAARKKLVGLAPQEQAAINAAANAKRKEIVATEAQIAADRRAKEEKRAKAQAQQFLTSVLQAGMSPTERLISQEARLNALLKAGSINSKEFAAAVASLKQQMKDLNKEVSLADQLMTRFLSLAFAKELAQKAIQFRSDSIDAFITLRDNLIKLEVILGDASKAKQLFVELRRIAVASNQTSEAVIRSAVTMAQFGVSTEELAPALKNLSEIAAGNSDRLQSLALAYGQVAAAGRLTGQETLQFVNAGFSPLAEMARTTGKDMRQLRKEMEAGNISFGMVTKSLQTATSEGGRFFGMADKLTKEYSGSVSRLTDNFTQLKEAVGEFTASASLLDTMSAALKEMTFIMRFYQNAGGLMQGAGLFVAQGDLRREIRLAQAELEMGLITQEMFEQRTKQKKQDLINVENEIMRIATGRPSQEEATKTESDRIKKQVESGIKASREALKRQQSEQGLFGSFMTEMGSAIEQGIASGMKTAETAVSKVRETERTFESLTAAFESAKNHLDTIKTPAQIQRELRDLAILVKMGMLSVKQATAFLASQDKTQKESISTDLPKAVSFGTKEAYELIMKTQNTMQAKQLEEQRKQRVAQEAANKLLTEIAKQPQIGIVQ